MDKDEILAKSVKENLIMDERDKHIRTHRDAFSLWGVIVLGISLKQKSRGKPIKKSMANKPFTNLLFAHDR